MRILFDKGTPRPLRRRLFGHEVETSVERGWDTLANGVLMDRAEEAGFDVLLTTDQSIRYQQNMSNRQIAVVVLMNTSWPRMARNTEVVRIALEGLQPGELKDVQIPLKKTVPLTSHIVVGMMVAKRATTPPRTAPWSPTPPRRAWKP